MSQTIELQELETEIISKSVSGSVHTAEYHSRRTHNANADAESKNPEEQHGKAVSKQKVKGHIQFVTLCWCLFMAGWNDGSTGPLLPRIREYYHVGFAVVSLIFVFACLVIVLGSTLQVIGYALQAPALPYPVFVIAYVINGAGLAMQDAQANGYVASIKENAETKMGILHAAYGAGAFAAPLVATQFAQLDRWSFHYLVSLGIAISNSIVLTMIFRLKGQDECLAEMGQPAGEKDSSEHSKFRQILGQRAVHYLAFFILVYVGVEVTIGGWIVTYVIDVRHGGPSSGYISSGFFGGLTIGRVALLWVNKTVGERRVLYLYTLLAIGLELVVWLVPSLIGGAVAVSLVGVLLGPFYPIAMNHAGRILPRWLLTGSIGWIAGFGQAGSAVLPFMTGALASKFGITSLQPLLISMMGLMIVLWTLVPTSQRRSD
ncbi:hypothetical protein ONZ45_g6401 [Pleurotus djamor]|nr:hypothetical protein ONZ45_g6401 [Pleurotus djamor]